MACAILRESALHGWCHLGVFAVDDASDFQRGFAVEVGRAGVGSFPWPGCGVQDAYVSRCGTDPWPNGFVRRFAFREDSRFVAAFRMTIYKMALHFRASTTAS